MNLLTFVPAMSLWFSLLPQNPFCDIVERKIGNTWYIVKTECDGNETLANKVKRLIFSENGSIS